MKKRFFALLAVICSGLVAFPFTACDNGNDGNDKNDDLITGVQVTEEEWNTAFERMLNATNLTCKRSGGYFRGGVQTDITENYLFNNETGTGYHERYEYQSGNFVEHTYESYLDIDGWIISVDQNSEARGPHYYSVAHTLHLSLNPTFVNEEYCAAKSDMDIYVRNRFCDLYSEFEFVDGEYRANLWRFPYLDVEDGFPEYSIKVRIDGDGYLRYCGIEYKLKEHVGGTVTGYNNYKFDDYGTTKVELSKDIYDIAVEYKELYV